MSFGGLTVEINQVSKSFESGLEPLKNISCEIKAGEFVSILGPSGCGKSTLLKMVAGLRKPSAGQIKVGENTSGAQKISYVFQEPQLLPWRKVLGNVMLPLELLGNASIDSELRARKALERVGLIDFESYYPAELSGGMKMRVSLARALVTEPELLLMDEPFAALDEITRFRLDEELRSLWSESQMTVLFVTHSISEAAFLSDRILLLSKKISGIHSIVSTSLPIDRSFSTRSDPRFTQLVSGLFENFKELEA